MIFRCVSELQFHVEYTKKLWVADAALFLFWFSPLNKQRFHRLKSLVKKQMEICLIRGGRKMIENKGEIVYLENRWMINRVYPIIHSSKKLIG